MHVLGSPAYRVEDSMEACAQALGLQGSFFSTPTAIFASLAGPGEEPKVHLLRVRPGDHDLARMAQLYSIRDGVVTGRVAPVDGLAQVREVLAGGCWVRPWLDVGAHALAGGAAAVLFGGDVRDVVVASGAGAMVGGVGVLAHGRSGLGDVQAALACALTGFVVHWLAVVWGGLSAPIATIAAIVVLLPGLSFTSALAELAMRHLAAGSARLMGTMAVLLTMAIGVGIGDRTALLCWGAVPHVEPVRLGLAWHLLALAASSFAFVVLLRASRAQAPWVLVAVLLGYGGARLGGATLGGELGAFVGAFAVTAAANLYARIWRRPAAVVRTPGLLLLVPGSLGLKGLTTALAGDFAASAPFVFQMLLVGGAIVAGLLFAGLLVPPPLAVEPGARGIRKFE